MNTNEKVIDTICHIRHCGDRYDMCQDMRSWVAERNGLIQDLLKIKKQIDRNRIAKRLDRAQKNISDIITKVTGDLWQGSDQVIAEQCFLKVLEEMQK
ncbi:phage protein [Streptococcus pyogenes]|uniref:hypothetical protein n=1 Tax=Streptococcus pyogenes TaxID=1314 RepID=UPI0010A18970|nr:hypothetical protein [Streptococcus pyogenes]VGR08731.1 phage protein [Streptococcus pyogenes]VHM67685.1 phage protein [Streptococcus pyogenes]